MEQNTEAVPDAIDGAREAWVAPDYMRMDLSVAANTTTSPSVGDGCSNLC